MICDCATRPIVLAVFSPCASRAPGPRRACLFTGHTGPFGSFATVSLSRGVPLPASWDPSTTGPNPRMGPGNAHGICMPFAVFPGPRVPAFLRFIPTCRGPNLVAREAAIFTTCRSHARLFELLPGEFQNLRAIDGAMDPLGFWVMLPRSS